MKKLALSFFAVAASIGPALAADLPSYKAPPPPPPPPAPMWTGFYLGVNIGGTIANNSSISTVGAPGPCDPTSGGGCALNPNYSLLSAVGATGVANTSQAGNLLGGGQIGYNYQFYNNFLIGFEADIAGVAAGSQGGSWGSVTPSANFPAQPVVTSASATRTLDYIGTVRGRLGWLAMPTLLVYGTGGFAYGSTNLSYTLAQHCLGCNWTIPPITGGSISDMLTGWTAGGGVEWMFWPNWSTKIEYLYYDLGTSRLNTVNAGTNPANGPLFLSSFQQTSARFDGHIIRAGLNYHFNWASIPVMGAF